jgi:hypothetical protein
MKIFITAVLGTLAAFVATGAGAAETKGAACSLLSTSDIEAVTGEKAGAPNPMDMDVPSGQTTHETMYACLWPVAATMGQVAVSMGRLPPGQSAQSLANHNAGMDALRAKHYKEEAKDFGNATCSVMTPPVSEKDGMNMSACSAGANGKIVSVTFMSPKTRLSIDKTKALLDRAIGRLR